MKPDKGYLSASQQRIGRVIRVLCGHELTGRSNQEITQAIGDREYNVTRTLANLAELGWAQQNPLTKRWSLTERFGQLANQVQVALTEAEGKIQEIRHRHTRTPL